MAAEIPTESVLPSGGRIQWRDVADIRGKDLVRISKAAVRLADGDRVQIVDAIRAVGTAMITGWDLPYLSGAPDPGNPDLLGELTIADYRAAYDIVQTWFLSVVYPELSDTEDPSVEGSPTEPGTASEPS